MSDTKASLVWGSLRNLVDFSNIEISSNIRLVDTLMGEFPVDSFHPLFLEVPRGLEKLDYSGRHNLHLGSTRGTPHKVEWNTKRIISLPIYDYEDELGEEDIHSSFSSLLLEWYRSFIPESIPCAAIAMKTSGSYTEEREAQDILVLLLWSSGISRCLTLEWFEGPVEDCISPEWYIRSTELLPLQEAFQMVRDQFKQLPEWDNPLYSIFVKPAALGKLLTNGKMNETPYRGWRNEWNYRKSEAFQEDIDKIVGECENLFMYH